MVPLGLKMICYGNSNSGVVLILGMKNRPINRLKSQTQIKHLLAAGI